MELPLFPLNTVLCPGIALPLHVFEDRYRALVRHCLDTTSPFGVVLIREGREVGPAAVSFRGVGTIAEIRDAGRHEDGRFDLLVVGTRRFGIRRMVDAPQPYLVADVDILEETVADQQIAEQLAGAATPRFVTYLELLQPRSGETSDEIDVRIEVETEDDEDADDDEADDDEADEDEGEATGGLTSPEAPGEPVQPAAGDEHDEPPEPQRRRRRALIP